LWIELALYALLALQVARLVWALLAPTGPFGDWRAKAPQIPGAQARQELFAAFDPFYRLAGADDGAVQQVTSLPLQLFGIRLNEGSGLGSAIIADEAGTQRSYAVGDEVAPGVTLKAVAFDHVVIERGGASEILYIDQSGSAAPSAATEDGDPALEPGDAVRKTDVEPGSEEAMTPDALLASVDMAPRLENGAITGIVVSARGNEALFAQAGFRSGDIVVRVNNNPVRGAGDIAALRKALVPGARLTLMVERGAATVPVALILPGKK
jgi:general secretion pathway protein C